MANTQWTDRIKQAISDVSKNASARGAIKNVTDNASRRVANDNPVLSDNSAYKMLGITSNPPAKRAQDLGDGSYGKNPFEDNMKLHRQIQAKNNAFGQFVDQNLDQYNIDEDTGNLVNMGLKYQGMARDEQGRVKADSNTGKPIWEDRDPTKDVGEWRAEVDKQGDPTSIFMSNYKDLEPIYNDNVRYSNAADFDKSGSVTEDEMEKFLEMMNSGWSTYDPSPEGYNKTGVYGNPFDYDDDGRLVYTNQYNNNTYVVPESYLDESTLGQAGGGIKFTLGGEDVRDDELGKRQAEYLMFRGLDPYFTQFDEEGKLANAGSVGDSWAAAQFAVNDRPSEYNPWWEQTMAEGSPVDYGFEYLRNRDDLWGEGGYDYNKYAEWNANQSKDLNAISDPLVYQSLYGSSPTAWNDVNRYLLKNEVPLWYLDAVYTDPNKLQGLLGAAQVDQYGRIPFTLGDLNSADKGKDALNLMNLMTLDTYLGEGIDMGEWDEGMLDQFSRLAGLGNDYNIVNAEDANIGEEAASYLNPYRVFGEDEIDWDTMMPTYNRDDVMSRLSNRLGDRGLGLYSKARE